MTEEAGNAATNHIIETFRKASTEMAQLEGQMSTLSKHFDNFARAFANPKRYKFEVHANELVVWETTNVPYKRVAQLSQEQLTWSTMESLVSSYEQARKDKSENADRLRNMGLPIAD